MGFAWGNEEEASVTDCITKEQAEAIAGERFPPDSYSFEVSDKQLDTWPIYWNKTPPDDCWYVTVNRKNVYCVGGNASVLCITKDTGEIVAEGSMTCE